MAKIDILLPYWGEFSLFKQTVESVLAQDDPNWQLLIFDDCYPTRDAEAYIKTVKDPRVTYYRHPENIGITNNFNFAVTKATAEYCSLLGCDDILLPGYVRTALQRIGDAELYQPGVQVINRDNNVYLPLGDKIKRILRPNRAGLYSGESLATSLCRGNWLYFPSIVWKTETLKRYPFDETYKIAEDVVVQLDMIKDGATLFLDNAVTFQYRRFADSLSSKEKGKSGVRFKEEDAVYDMFTEKFKLVGWKRAARAAKLRPVLRIYHMISR